MKLAAFPCFAPALLAALPHMVVLLKLESVAVACLNIVFVEKLLSHMLCLF